MATWPIRFCHANKFISMGYEIAEYKKLLKRRGFRCTDTGNYKFEVIG